MSSKEPKQYWDLHNNGRWHFLRTSDNIKTYEGTVGKTVIKLLKENPNFITKIFNKLLTFLYRLLMEYFVMAC